MSASTNRKSAITLTLKVPPALAAELTEAAERDRRSRASWIRIACEDRLAAEKRAAQAGDA